MKPQSELEPQNVVANLKELRTLTGDQYGAQREAWSETWQKARTWLWNKLDELPVLKEIDEAGNTWATLPGKSPRELVMGSHIDSVPNGGWLDGCLGVVGGLEVLRRLAAGPQPPVTVRLVSWADEEGSRFNHSLIGSGTVTRRFDPPTLQNLPDRNGNKLGEVLAGYNVHLASAGLAARQVANTAAYLELHIEQGPVLEHLKLPLGTVLGSLGVERHSIRFTGQAAHAGSTPMEMRRDALAPAARLELEIREIARRNGGVCTVGSVVTRPGIVTAVVGQCDMLLDQRHLDAAGLEKMLQEARDASFRFASEEKVEVEWRLIFHIPPAHFHPDLIELCSEAIQETAGANHRLPSGPLHDASYVAVAGIPTAMIFVQSLRGLSHTIEEDSREEHITLGVSALDRLAAKTMGWIAAL